MVKRTPDKKRDDTSRGTEEISRYLSSDQNLPGTSASKNGDIEDQYMVMENREPCVFGSSREKASQPSRSHGFDHAESSHQKTRGGILAESDNPRCFESAFIDPVRSAVTEQVYSEPDSQIGREPLYSEPDPRTPNEGIYSEPDLPENGEPLYSEPDPPENGEPLYSEPDLPKHPRNREADKHDFFHYENPGDNYARVEFIGNREKIRSRNTSLTRQETIYSTINH